MKQALSKLCQKANVKIKPTELASLIREGLSYEPLFVEAIAFLETLYNMIPVVWMVAFSDPKIIKALIN